MQHPKDVEQRLAVVQPILIFVSGACAIEVETHLLFTSVSFHNPAQDVMDLFEYNANSTRVVLGPGSIQKLPGETKRLGLEAPLLLSTSQQAHQTEDLVKILSTE